MGLYTGNNNWTEEVYQFETTDLVLGGPDGIDNRPLKELADRTIWLRNALRGYNGVTVVNASQPLTKPDVILKLVVLMVTGGTAIIDLPTLTSDDTGLRVTLASFSQRQLTINSPVPITCFSFEDRTKLYISDGEKIELIWTGAKYVLLDYSGNFLKVGEFGQGYNIKPNTIAANGALLLRAEYPRLFEWVQVISNSVVSESVWNTTPGYKGFFTTGTNSTNFRIPDLRAMFIRHLDLGAGIDFGRNNENPGGYEADDIRSHDHDYTKPAANGSASGNAVSHPDGPLVNAKTGPTGGMETRPRNIGLIPFLYV